MEVTTTIIISNDGSVYEKGINTTTPQCIHNPTTEVNASIRKKLKQPDKILRYAKKTMLMMRMKITQMKQ